MKHRKQSVVRRPAPEPPRQGRKESSNESLQQNIGDESQTTGSRPISSRSNQRRSANKITDFKNLSIANDSSAPRESSRHGVKRSAAKDSPDTSRNVGEERLSPRTRKVKTAADSQLDFLDGAARRSRREAPRLFNPESDAAVFGSSAKGILSSSSLPAARGLKPRVEKDVGSRDPEPGIPSTARLQVDVDQGNSTNAPEAGQSQWSPSDATDVSYDEPELLLQPETRPVPYEQLVDEVKGIYGGLVMVETKCIEVDHKQTMAVQDRLPTKLTPEQYSALTALHKTLLNEHHDFFLATQHPSATPALRRLPAKYSIPARMWRHGIHAFLEVLRFRLPESLDHMLTFIYIAYSMMALLYETVPTFEDTWIECLGDIGRYRMAIEDDDIRDREIWSSVARSWYQKAADRNPEVRHPRNCRQVT